MVTKTPLVAGPQGRPEGTWLPQMVTFHALIARVVAHGITSYYNPVAAFSIFPSATDEISANRPCRYVTIVTFLPRASDAFG
jgi:hypothetical protein